MLPSKKEQLRKELATATKVYFAEGKKVTVIPTSEVAILNQVNGNNNLKNLIIAR